MLINFQNGSRYQTTHTGPPVWQPIDSLLFHSFQSVPLPQHYAGDLDGVFPGEVYNDTTQALKQVKPFDHKFTAHLFKPVPLC